MKEKENIMKELKRATSMLSNEAFVSKAPEALVNKEKEKVQKYNELLEKVENRISKFN